MINNSIINNYLDMALEYNKVNWNKEFFINNFGKIKNYENDLFIAYKNKELDKVFNKLLKESKKDIVLFTELNNSLINLENKYKLRFRFKKQIKVLYLNLLMEFESFYNNLSKKEKEYYFYMTSK